MTLQNHVNKGSGEFMEAKLLYIPTLPKLTAIGIVLMDMYNYFSLWP